MDNLVSSKWRLSIFLTSCSILHEALQFQNKKEQTFRTRILPCDRSAFTSLISLLQLSHGLFKPYQFYRAMEILWCSCVAFFPPQVFQLFFQIQSVSAFCLLVEAVPLYFLDQSCFSSSFPSFASSSTSFYLGSFSFLQFPLVLLSSSQDPLANLCILGTDACIGLPLHCPQCMQQNQGQHREKRGMSLLFSACPIADLSSTYQ